MNQLLNRKNNQLSVKKKKGFTLIELIIVIAIIAILAAIAIPKFGAARQQANLRADQANAKIIATAVAQAVANGDIIATDAELDDTEYAKYIDGGAVPKVQSDSSNDWTVGYEFDTDDASGKGVTVTINGKQMYPIS